MEFPEPINKLFFEFDDSELVVIKTHLGLEYMIEKFIEIQNKSEVSIEKMSFTFSQKVNIAKILGLFSGNNELELFVLDLNKLRNQVAHKHSVDDLLFDKIVNYPKGFEGQDRWKTKREYRIAYLGLKSSYIYGTIQHRIDVLKKLDEPDISAGESKILCVNEVK